MYQYTTAKELRKELSQYKETSGIYIITAGPTTYVGQSGDLYKRLSVHIGNMEPTNKPKLKGSALKLRTAAIRHGYRIEVFPIEQWALNFYEDFAVALRGSISKSKKDRKGRSGVPNELDAAFSIATEGQFELFKQMYNPRKFW